MTSPREERCSCGGYFAPSDLPPHRYLTPSSGCWAAYGEVLAAEYQDLHLMQTIHGLTVDTYSVQHRGDGSGAAVRSLCLHLASLSVAMGGAEDASTLARAKRAFTKADTFLDLQPPEVFTMTIGDVLPHAGTPRHSEIIRQYARETWEDWSQDHARIRAWTEGLL